MKCALLVLIASSMLSIINGGKSTLEDPLGLFEENEPYFRFGTGKNYVFGTVWPKPQEEIRENVYYTLDSNSFEFIFTGQVSDVLRQAVLRYEGHTFPDKNTPADSQYKLLSQLEVHVEQEEKAMDINTDESYMLVVEAPQSRLYAKTVWGAMRGLETFSQVVYQNEKGYYFAQKNKIVDFPRFPHRGFLISSGKHYLKLEILHKFIDALSYSKFNLLHWHVVDDLSFAYVSKKFSALHGKGAWNNLTHVYTPDDIQNVIEYAKLRGVRVMPEFDTPGHTLSWHGIPNLLTPCYTNGKPDGTFGPINPTLESNYDFLDDFFSEATSTFPDLFMHLGGDEVDFHCWKSNPDIVSWMQIHGMGKNFSLLEQYYEQRLLDIVKKYDKTYVIWQEVIDNHVKVRDSTVVNVWKGDWQKEMEKVTGLGYRAILSSCWYLGYISYGLDWRKYYNCDPHNFNGTEEQKQRVLGGTACMWGRWVDGTNLLSRTWARGLSAGERLWSSKNTTDFEDALQRIWEHRCRYLRRGIPAENVVQDDYCRHEWNN